MQLVLKHWYLITLVLFAVRKLFLIETFDTVLVLCYFLTLPSNVTLTR